MLKLVTPPTDPVVPLAEAKAHLRIFHDDDNTYIEALVAAAVGNLDGADGWLGRALAPQTWEYSTDRFPCDDHYRRGRLHIPLSPLISVDSVEYLASVGTTGTIADFRVFGVGSRQPGYIVPAMDDSWPSTKCEPEAVTVTFTAGYVNDADAVAIPAGIKHAILLMVGHWYEHREDVSDAKVAKIPMASEYLLMPHRNWRG